jgi:hypothetical protein
MNAKSILSTRDWAEVIKFRLTQMKILSKQVPIPIDKLLKLKIRNFTMKSNSSIINEFLKLIDEKSIYKTKKK